MAIIKGTSSKPKKPKPKQVGGRPVGAGEGQFVPRPAPPPTMLEVNRDPKTIGNAVTGTSPYKTKYWRKPKDLNRPATPNKPKPRVRKWEPGVKPRPRPNPKGKPKGGGHGGGGGGGGPEESGLPRLVPGHTEADIAETSLLRAQGKAYAYGLEGRSKTRAGQTGKGREDEDEDEKEKRGGGGRRRRRKLKKVRGHRQESGVRPGFHINKDGKIVRNKGKQK